MRRPAPLWLNQSNIHWTVRQSCLFFPPLPARTGFRLPIHLLLSDSRPTFQHPSFLHFFIDFPHFRISSSQAQASLKNSSSCLANSATSETSSASSGAPAKVLSSFSQFLVTDSSTFPYGCLPDHLLQVRELLTVSQLHL